MTSASELFCQRRSRIGRVTTTEPESEPISSDRHHRRNHHSHSRHDFDGCDPLRRSPRIRNPCHRLSSISERGFFRVDQASSQPSINTEDSSSNTRVRLSENDRLPGAVLLARARLVERLRGVSASANRRTTRVSLDISDRDYTSGGSSDETERRQPVQEPDNKKPPGLTSEDINSLHLEIYSSLDEKEETSFLSRDCSICLESFEEGDKLRHLQCEHRFHVACLDRWIQTCGDCPYCRRDIHVC